MMKSIHEEFTAIVRDYQSGLRAYIRRLGITADWVDDVAQEVFLVAYRRWDDFDPDRDIRRWLYGIARNLVANELRKNHRKARIIYTPIADKLLIAADNEERLSSWQESSRLIQALQECLQKLPRLHRDILYRRYADQANTQQLSDQLRISPGAFRLRLMRIRMALKRCVEGKVT